mmetsp:Transcript_34971/g.91550  ORF Transcript_34971/g.91550 Transcript_34971/m.91550 type:complete len:298 (+) Transcript_34971:2133-3026(+)
MRPGGPAADLRVEDLPALRGRLWTRGWACRLPVLLRHDQGGPNRDGRRVDPVGQGDGRLDVRRLQDGVGRPRQRRAGLCPLGGLWPPPEEWHPDQRQDGGAAQGDELLRLSGGAKVGPAGRAAAAAEDGRRTAQGGRGGPDRAVLQGPPDRAVRAGRRRRTSPRGDSERPRGGRQDQGGRLGADGLVPRERDDAVDPEGPQEDGEQAQPRVVHRGAARRRPGARDGLGTARLHRPQGLRPRAGRATRLGQERGPPRVGRRARAASCRQEGRRGRARRRRRDANMRAGQLDRRAADPR